jgi:hypothetical protein
MQASQKSENQTVSRYYQFFLFVSLFLVSPVTASYGDSPPSVALLEPAAKNTHGVEITEMTIGEQAELVLSFYNTVSKDDDLHFGAVIEVRNSDDVTIFFAWQSSRVAPDEQYHFSTSWIPEQDGTYYLKTRVITALPPAEIRSVLSPVLETKMIVV